jgi:anaerobic C4-dicarboxylate transporter
VEIKEFVLKAFPNLGTDFTLSYLDEEGDKIHVDTDMELLEATQPSTKENVLLIRLTVESRQKTLDHQFIQFQSIEMKLNKTTPTNNLMKNQKTRTHHHLLRLFLFLLAYVNLVVVIHLLLINTSNFITTNWDIITLSTME